MCYTFRHDWGALILVDERYSKGNKYTRGLSKWIRHRISHQPDFTDAIESLKSFMQSHLFGNQSLPE